MSFRPPFFLQILTSPSRFNEKSMKSFNVPSLVILSSSSFHSWNTLLLCVASQSTFDECWTWIFSTQRRPPAQNWVLDWTFIILSLAPFVSVFFVFFPSRGNFSPSIKTGIDSKLYWDWYQRSGNSSWLVRKNCVVQIAWGVLEEESLRHKASEFHGAFVSP